MPDLRKCARCGKPALKPVSRELQIYNSVVHYKCSECEAEVDLTPIASIGVLTMVGTLAIAFWGFILFTGAVPPGWIALTLFGLAILALGFVTLAPALAHHQNPVVKSDVPAELPVDNKGSHIARRPIIWIERFGFLAGLLAPLLLIFGVLAIATLIGYINYTFFGN
jgi:DNA-directed RNA polymerase subunit RPC12/RpoP